jgi:hypothetical protein
MRNTTKPYEDYILETSLASIVKEWGTDAVHFVDGLPDTVEYEIRPESEQVRQE